jgi:cation diffusion facilitator family transporter
MAAERTLERYAWLSLSAAVVTVALKTYAWYITGSVGLLSDALETVVNIAAALLTLSMLKIAAAPPDARHPYGRFKAEYFASGAEGALIVFAAVSIALTAAPRLAAPQALQTPLLGIALSALATAVNLGVALRLLAVGRREHSIALEADGRHLMTDVWTSIGVIAGVLLTAATGWLILDPLIALAVAAHIVWTGFMLMRRSYAGLLDAAIAPNELADIERIFADYRERHGVAFHALLTRQAGTRRFVSFHLLVPDTWPVDRAHALSEEIEARIRAQVPRAITLTHIEPISQPASYEDIQLER